MKRYELVNHLGNVQAVISDRALPVRVSPQVPAVSHYQADLLSATDYYPFGMTMAGRSLNTDDYRYGFNGKEFDQDWDGGGATYDYGARIYDPRVARWASVDPMAGKYPTLAPYVAFANDPIFFIDQGGETLQVASHTAPNPAQFEQSVTVALAYLRKSPTAAAIIDKIERSSTTITIAYLPTPDKWTGEGKYPGPHYDPRTQTVYWNPELTSPNSEASGGGENSPAFILGHELGHGEQDIDGKLPALQKERDDIFHRDAEKELILGKENKVSEELKEVKRKGHEGGDFKLAPTVPPGSVNESDIDGVDMKKTTKGGKTTFDGQLHPRPYKVSPSGEPDLEKSKDTIRYPTP